MPFSPRVEESSHQLPASSAVPATMQAAVYHGLNDVRLETVPVPAIGRGEVLIKVHSCGICGTDLKKIHTGSHSAPRIFGHETVGTIAAVGAGAEPFAVGDRVAVFHHIPCGACYYCRKQTFAQCAIYKQVGCTAGYEPSGGGFAGYVRVMDWIVQRGLIKIPDYVPFAQAVFAEPLNTCLKAIRSLCLSFDETVLVRSNVWLTLFLLTMKSLRCYVFRRRLMATSCYRGDFLFSFFFFCMYNK